MLATELEPGLTLVHSEPPGTFWLLKDDRYPEQQWTLRMASGGVHPLGIEVARFNPATLAANYGMQFDIVKTLNQP